MQKGLIKRFLRLDHFTPFYVVMAPAILCGLTLGYAGTILPTLVKVSISSILLIIGGCVYNDWIDLDYDRQCARAMTRPMAARQVSEKNVCWCILFFTGFLFTGCWYYQTAHIFMYLALLLTLFYPFAKRIMKIPQIILGLVNFAPVMVFIQTTDNAWPLIYALPFYIMGVIWIVLYDTLYAWTDIEDDRKLGLGNLGLLLGKKYMPMFIDLSWLMMWMCWAIYLDYQTWFFWITLLLFVIQGFRQKSAFIKNQL